MKIEPGSNIVVWFSCGAASAVAAKKTVELYGATCNISIVNSPIYEEDIDNRRFLKDVESWAGVNIKTAINFKYPMASAVEVWEDRQYMSGIKGAPCTGELKKEARYQYEEKHKIDFHVLGFTADEKSRYNKFIITERPNVIPVLIDAGLTKQDCFDVILDAGIKLPESYLLGMPNANCYGCVKASSPTYWNHIRKIKPDVFKERAEQSRRIGCRLVRYKGKRIFLDELPEDAIGRPMKSMNFECGIFCEEIKI